LEIIGACIIGAAGVFVAGSLVYLAMFLPFTVRSARLLPKPGRTTVDGITTIEDAVKVLKTSGLSGLGLVARAQGLTAGKMEYSRRNPWDSWSRCFERGMGYCIQQGMALRTIYDRLGIESRPVQAFRCAFPEGVVQGVKEPARVSGHMWLRVRVDGKDYDVCPGSESNTPGSFHFKPLSPVRKVRSWTVPLLHAYSAAENVRRDWKNLFPGRKA
jgi:hypothetical protein